MLSSTGVFSSSLNSSSVEAPIALALSFFATGASSPVFHRYPLSLSSTAMISLSSRK